MSDRVVSRKLLNLRICLFNRSTVKLMLRKVQYAPDSQGVPPTVETTKDFVMSDKPLHVKATLDKEVCCFML